MSAAPVAAEPQTGSSTGRPTLAWVTWLRIAAVYGVVLLHAFAPLTTPDRRGTRAWAAGATLQFLGGNAVPLFVMISGALVLRPVEPIHSGEILRKRVNRLVPPLFFWNAVYLVWALRTTSTTYTVRSVIGAFLNGTIGGHLYFLWIVLGLGCCVPVLQRWIRDTDRREWLIGGAMGMTLPLGWSMLHTVAAIPGDFPNAAWNYWMPYLGYFILGYALRGVVLPPRWVALAVPVAAACVAYCVWAYENPHPPKLLAEFAPLGYYGPVVVVYTIVAFLIGQALVRPGRALGALAAPGVLRRAAPVGAATLGIFALHPLLLFVLQRYGWADWGPGPFGTCAARALIAAAVATAVVLPLRRVPLIDRVL